MTLGRINVFFKQLQRETETGRQGLFTAPIIVDTMQGRITLKQYIAFLTQAYHHVRHTVPLLMATGSRLPESVMYSPVREALAHYIEEEVGHEEWILNDIAACGADKEAVRNSRPDLPAELMVAFAYHQVDRKNPMGFFGMVHVLEGTSTSIATAAADRIQDTLGLPDNAFSYLRSHGSLDLEHVEFFEKLMNGVQSEQDRTEIIHCAHAFYRLYGNVFRGLPEYEEPVFAEVA